MAKEIKTVTGIERFTKLLDIAKLDAKPHQLEGVQWMLNREMQSTTTDKVFGGINADEMGLGKTIMMIGTIVCNFKKRTLIVVPFVLLEQWCEQVFRVTGHEPLVYHGTAKKDYDEDTVKSAPIVLTTYGHVSYSKTMGLLHKVKWDRVVFDEAHHMRNGKGKTFHGAKMLRASIRWLLTGTPIQNKKSDLYALLDVLGFSPASYKDEEVLEKIIKEVVLKRTKREAGVILPEKHEKVVKVEWSSEEEKKLAKDIHSRLKFSGVCDGMTKSDMVYGSCALVKLLRARQICVMPELIVPGIFKVIKEVDKSIQDDEEGLDSEREKASLKKIIENLGKIHESGISSKIKAVCEQLVKNKENGKQKLVFCQFRTEIDLVEKLLKEKGFKTESIDGRTPKEQRDEYLSSKDIDVLVLQIQTGCEGLNLQTFSEVYFVSPHWNPAVEDQAVARCHRIGQKEEVDVFRFEMENFGEDTQSLENHARNVQETKRELYELFE